MPHLPEWSLLVGPPAGHVQYTSYARRRICGTLSDEGSTPSASMTPTPRGASCAGFWVFLALRPAHHGCILTSHAHVLSIAHVDSTAHVTAMNSLDDTAPGRSFNAFEAVRPGIESVTGARRWKSATWHSDDLFVATRAKARPPVVVGLRRRTAARWLDLSGDFSALAHATRHNADADASRWIVLIAPRAGRRLLAELASYAAEVDPDANWLVALPSGAVQLSSSAQIRTTADTAAAQIRSGQGRPRPINLFTDANARILKVLLYGALSNTRWQCNTLGRQLSLPIESLVQLAFPAAVTPETVYRFYEAFAAEGFVVRDPHLRLTQTRALLARWLDETAATPTRDHHVKWAAATSPLNTIEAVETFVADIGDSQSSVVLTGGAAAHMFGMSRAPWRLPVFNLISGELSDFIHRHALRAVEPRDAHLVLRLPRDRMSVNLGSVTHRFGTQQDYLMHVADPVQVALDVVREKPRGREQAEFIMQRVCELAGA